MTRLTIRIDFGNGTAIGPGKVRLLELVGETGSIRKAAGQMKMSYRRAWLLLKALGDTFGDVLVETATGGKAGGGARLTQAGGLVVKQYRGLERAATKAAGRNLAALSASAGVAKTAQKRAVRGKAGKIRKPR
jgi:molybdate transport system regulatory protein